MHIVANKNMQVEICGLPISFVKGETIHTENSYKYHPEEFKILARSSGWIADDFWSDSKNLFSIHILSK